MRKTGENYYKKFNTADISVIGDYGIDEENVKAINKTKGAKTIEYGYLKDVVIKDTLTSIRVFSSTNELSQYDIKSGRMPKNNDEIAIASYLSDKCKIGDTIYLSEKKDIAGEKVLKNHNFKVVGYINSSELVSSINIGQSTAGTGELNGFAVVLPSAFDSEVYMIARISYNDTIDLDPYSDEYTDLIQTHKNELDKILADQPNLRLQSIKDEYQEKIDDGQKKIDDAKEELSNAKEKLDDAKKQINNAKDEVNSAQNKLDNSVANATAKINTAENKLKNAKNKIDNNTKKLETAKVKINEAEKKLTSAKSKYKESKKQYNEKYSEYIKSKKAIDDAQTQINSAQAKIDKNKSTLESGKKQYESGIAKLKTSINSLEYLEKTSGLNQQQSAQLTELKKQLQKTQNEYNQFIDTTYNPSYAKINESQKTLDNKKSQLAVSSKELESAKAKLDSAKAKLDKAEKEIKANEEKLNNSKSQYKSGVKKLSAAKAEYSDKKAELNSAKQKLETEKSSGEQKITDAKSKIAEKESEYNNALKKYNKKKPKADKKIADGESDLADARNKLKSLELPVYALDTRREIPGAEGYKIYGSVSNIVDSLADIFPIFLYFVAALVTLTTMTRFVDEERINSGTLKALGYSDNDIRKKFIVYGALASLIGAAIGIAAGHTLIPIIAYNAYGNSFILPKIELHFYPIITIIAILLALACAVLPAYIVSMKELQAKPASLLLPKPPSKGSKIFLERIKPIWSKMNFTHKVTARNIFRYKKRMLMTIFGVCGAVTLLFAGFSIQHSISGINSRQFGDIMKYDIIVAQEGNLNDDEKSEITTALSSGAIKSQMPIYYDEVTKIAGNKNDKQAIKLIVPQNNKEFSNYIKLINRKKDKSLSLDNNGVIISERLAKLLNVNIGDSITITDSGNTKRKVTVSNITEMYAGHFMFMSGDYFNKVYQRSFSPNANLISLKDRSNDNAKIQAEKLMKLEGVKGIVINTTLINQMDTIVNSLSKIMNILIVIAMLLAVVILYNLTNINVSERIRELSTIKVLGFYDNEVTLYIYRETILLTILGIIAGFAAGDILFQYIIAVVPPDEIMFNPTLGLKAFIIPTVAVSVITVVLGFVINKRLKKLNMLEALKSVD